MIYIFVIIVGIIFLVEYFMENTGISKNFSTIPGTRRLPIVGNGLDLIGSTVRLFYATRRIGNTFRNRDNICREKIFHIRVINSFEPDDLEVLLSSMKHIEKGYIYDFLHSWLNEGLLTSKGIIGEKWQHRRKILTPTFHFNILRQFCKVFVEQSDNLVKKLQAEVGKEETTILPFITDFALQVISETAMGSNLDSTKESVNNYKKAVYEMGEIILNRSTKIWLQIPFLFSFTKGFKVERKALDILHEFTGSIINERRSKRNEVGNVIDVEHLDENKALGMKQRLAMLDLLLKAESEGKINQSGIREEVDTFMFEGHDTTTMSIMFTLMLLANNPEVQNKIVAELNEVLRNSDEFPTIEHYNQMNYLEMCIKEALRLYPSVPAIGRYLTEDMKLKKYTVPAGTTVFVHIFDVHRNPDLYKDPDRFDPERFSPENSRTRHPYAYIPFSAGPRNCIGQKFAMLEEKAVLSAIIRNFKLEPITRPDDIIFFTDLVLRSTVPIKVKFVSRAKE